MKISMALFRTDNGKETKIFPMKPKAWENPESNVVDVESQKKMKFWIAGSINRDYGEGHLYLEGSNDGTSFTVLYDLLLPSYNWYEASGETSTPFRYYRIKLTGRFEGMAGIVYQ